MNENAPPIMPIAISFDENGEVVPKLGTGDIPRAYSYVLDIYAEAYASQMAEVELLRIDETWYDFVKGKVLRKTIIQSEANLSPHQDTSLEVRSVQDSAPAPGGTQLDENATSDLEDSLAGSERMLTHIDKLARNGRKIDRKAMKEEYRKLNSWLSSGRDRD